MTSSDNAVRNTSLRGALPTAAGLLIMLIPLAGCGRSLDLETAQRFQQAESAFATAATSQDFARVAAQYDHLLADGTVSGAVLYNRGNAWMRAGETGRAIASWRHAQRYRPRDPWLAANLQSALAASQSTASVTPDLGVAGYVFFWQSWLSYSEKFLLTTVLLLAACTSGVVSQLRGRGRLLRRLTAAMLALAVVAAASAGWDWYRFDQTVHGVVTADTTEARKGNAESYAAAFTKPLQEGTEFRVLEQRAGWLNIEIEGLGTAWIPAGAAETW